jgi:hypothetical protein
MLMGKYSLEALESIIETRSYREVAAKKAIEAAGGESLGFYGMFGQEHHVATIADMPGTAESIGVISPAIISGTLASWKTIPLYTAGDVVKASKIAKKVAGAYRPPARG